jgi:hypothetical protein
LLKKILKQNSLQASWGRNKVLSIFTDRAFFYHKKEKRVFSFSFSGGHEPVLLKGWMQIAKYGLKMTAKWKPFVISIVLKSFF